MLDETIVIHHNNNIVPLVHFNCPPFLRGNCPPFIQIEYDDNIRFMHAVFETNKVMHNLLYFNVKVDFSKTKL